ncbi:ribokinase/sulfofructose kinase [Pedococcus cremeus]|uniref:Ribokinase/sulfofructose kinase n=1 Tax=Pedococcus cremeus TaxID=587636 RepID=A0A1H9XPQ1_9MICO|nr:PfkB family carbohydrate kinase [Pedococcus cremeus]SES48134.1 ribokinase/sulfofructose kinase [Pedococcus cremeus]
MGHGQPKVLFVGAATVDSIALVPAFPHPDQRVVADELVFAGGGPAATAAVAASRLGVPASFVGTVGDDSDGRRILEGLEDEGVDVSLVTIARGVRSGASVIVVDHGRGTRAICARPGPALDPSSVATAVRGAEWVHTDHVGWEAVRAAVPATGSGPRLSVDLGYQVEGFTPRGVDLFAPSIEALRAAHGSLDPEALLSAALDEGARRVVATDGSRGSWGADASGERAQAPGVSVEVVSTLGAGDVFHGALLAAHVRGYGLEAALRYANTTAALSCLGLDGRSAIPDHEHVEAHLGAPTPTS